MTRRMKLIARKFRVRMSFGINLFGIRGCELVWKISSRVRQTGEESFLARSISITSNFLGSIALCLDIILRSDIVSLIILPQRVSTARNGYRSQNSSTTSKYRSQNSSTTSVVPPNNGYFFSQRPSSRHARIQVNLRRWFAPSEAAHQ